MRSVRRKIMAVVAVIGVAVVAGLTLAKSWPFTGGSKPSAVMGSTVVRKLGARAAAGALNRRCPGPHKTWVAVRDRLRNTPRPNPGATLAWRRGRHASTTVQIDLGNAWVTGVEKTAMTRILNRCSGLSGTPRYATMGL